MMNGLRTRVGRAATALAGAALLAITPGTVAVAAAAPVAVAGGGCNELEIWGYGDGYGLTPGTTVTITVDVWQMSDLESESRTQTVAPDGTIAGHSFWTEDIIAFATAKATIRSGAGTVLAVSPEVSIGCPPW